MGIPRRSEEKGVKGFTGTFETPRELAYKIEQETLQIEALKSSLKLTNDLSLKAVHTLSSFDSRLAKLESSILPIHDATQLLTRFNENVCSTIDSLTSIIEHLDIASSDEQFIIAGPKGKSIKIYIEAVGRLRTAKSYLDKANLKAFQKNQSQIVQVLKAAHQHLIFWLRSQLESCSLPVDPCSPESNLQVDAKIISRLVDIMKHIKLTEKDSQAKPNDFLGIISQTRSTYLLKSFGDLAKDSSPTNRDQFAGGSIYVKGTCPYINFTRHIIKFFEYESELLSQLIPVDDFSPTFSLTISACYQKYLEIGENLISYAKKDLHNEIFLLFDILENLLNYTQPLKIVLKTAERSDASFLAMITSISNTLMKSFPTFLEDIKNGANRQTQLSTDGTVHEMTSGALNFIKRLLEYPSTVDMTLQNLGISHICLKNDFIKDNPNGSVFSMRYFTNVFEALIQYSEIKARGYKTKTLAAIFQLNNVHYLLKAVQTSPNLPKYVHFTVIEKLEKLISQHMDVYHESWKSCLECITDSSLTRVQLNSSNTIGKASLTSSERAVIKDKLKAFNLAFEELHRTQKAYTLSDPDLRRRVIDQILTVLLPIYSQSVERLRNSDFSKTPSKYIKYDKDSLTQAVNGFFDLAS